MQMIARRKKDVLVVKLSGRLDVGSAPDFEKQCSAWIEGGNDIIVMDFAGLEYISSMGLRSILSMVKKAWAAGGRLTVCNPSGLVKQIIGESGFHDIIPFYATVAEAIKAKPKAS